MMAFGLQTLRNLGGAAVKMVRNAVPGLKPKPTMTQKVGQFFKGAAKEAGNMVKDNVVGATAMAALGGAGKMAKGVYKAIPLPGFIKAPLIAAGATYGAYRGVRALNQRILASELAQQGQQAAEKTGILSKVGNLYKNHPIKMGLATAAVVGGGIWGASKLMGSQKPENQSPTYGDNTENSSQTNTQDSSQTTTQTNQASMVNNGANEKLTPNEHREAARSAFDGNKENTALANAFANATGGKKIKEIAGRQAGTVGGTSLMQTEDGGIYSSGITKDGKVAFAAKGAVEEGVKSGMSFSDSWKKNSGIALQFADTTGKTKANIALSGAVASSNVNTLSTQLQSKQKALNTNVSKALNDTGYVFAASNGNNYGVLSLGKEDGTNVTMTIGQDGTVQVFSAKDGQGQEGLPASASGLEQDVATQGVVTLDNVDQFLEILGKKGFKMNNISKSMDITDQPSTTETSQKPTETP
ncbi:MAG: hypothetical protein ACKO37_04900 [Vampirovibrionales bacterium]